MTTFSYAHFHKNPWITGILCLIPGYYFAWVIQKWSHIQFHKTGKSSVWGKSILGFLFFLLPFIFFFFEINLTKTDNPKAHVKGKFWHVLLCFIPFVLPIMAGYYQHKLNRYWSSNPELPSIIATPPSKHLDLLVFFLIFIGFPLLAIILFP